MGAHRYLNGSTQEGTYTHTYRQTDIATMTESAQWADSVKIRSKYGYNLILQQVQMDANEAQRDSMSLVNSKGRQTARSLRT